MPSNFSDKAQSRALSQQLAKDLLQRLDMSRYPVQRIKAGAWLRRSGQRLDSLPFIEAGRINAVLQLGDQGTQAIPVTFGPGEVALLSTLFSEEPIHGDLVAAESLDLRWLPVHDIEAALLEDRALLVCLVRFLAQRLREVQTRERGWLERSVHGRVCATLARVALETPPAPEQPWLIPATHEYLAMRCGVSRPKLSHELKELEQAGILKLNRGTIELIDYAALTSVS